MDNKQFLELARKYAKYPKAKWTLRSNEDNSDARILVSCVLSINEHNFSVTGETLVDTADENSVKAAIESLDDELVSKIDDKIIEITGC